MSQQSFTTFALIALMVVAFYFLIMRPQKKRQQAQQKTMNSLGPGSRVMTGSGLFGTIVTMGDKQAVLEIAPGVQITVLKQAIARVVTSDDEDSAHDDEDDEDTDEPDVVLDEHVVESDLSVDDEQRPGTDTSNTTKG